MNEKAYEYLGYGLFKSARVKRLIIQNCNLGVGGSLHHMCDGMYDEFDKCARGLNDVRSLEHIDFQCNELENRHCSEITEIICS